MDTQARRTKGIADSQTVAGKSRFGMFSQPLSHAIGDDGQYKVKIHPRDQTGKPVTVPRGIFTNPNKKGQLKKTFFSDINTLAAMQDQYVDPARKIRQIQNQTFNKGYNKQQPLKPASLAKTLHKPAYEYIDQSNPELDPKRNRGQQGNVKIPLRNVFTNQQSTVIRNYFKPLEHITDPYERAHQMDVEHMKKQKAMEAQAAYRPNSFTLKLFSDAKTVYGQDVELKARTAREPKFNIMAHQNKWKASNPGKVGYNKFFSKTAYIEDPPKERQPISLGKQREVFKRMSVPKSIVSPSVTLTNIKRSFNKSFTARR